MYMWYRVKIHLICCLLLSCFCLRAQPPEIAAVVNAASSRAQVSPLSLVTIFGAGFGSAAADVAVSVGALDAPILFASPSQINVQFPFELPVGPAVLTVSVRGQVSEPVSITVAPDAPGLFMQSGRAILTDADGGLIRVAAPGQVVTAYATGLGPLAITGVAGTLACAAQPSITVSGLTASLQFAGSMPGQPGVYQIKFAVPAAAPGIQDLIVSAGGVQSEAVTISIGGIFVPRGGAPSNSGQLVPAGTITSAIHGVGAGTVSINVGPSESAPPAAGSSIMRQHATPGHGTVTYTCDPSITAVAGLCNTLNTTIANLYSNAFQNVNANIYITFGSTGLGESIIMLNFLDYSSYRSDLTALASDANDQLALAASVPATNPFGNDQLVITNPHARALGYQPSSGITANQSYCTAGTSGCYDGIIIISSAIQASGSFYFRSGAIGGGQFDFFTVAEHETDEIIGTPSCAFGCNFSGTNAFAPADLFRYHSNGTRSFSAGTNDSCAASSAANACFSLDSVHMLQSYNNVNNGEDAGDWVTNCSAQLVQDAALCPGLAGVDISPQAEIEVLDVIGFTVAAPSLSITKTHSGNFNQGQQNARYTITVSNAAGAPASSSAVTVTDAMPPGLMLVSMSGSGWSCSGTTCSRSDGLAGGASFPAITVTVNVGASATSPQVNSASVSGGGSVTASTTDSTTITNTSGGGGSPASFLTAYALSNATLRNNFTGWVGFKFVVGGTALSITSLGRVCISGNSGTHVVKLVNAASGTDVGGGSATVNLAGCTPGQFVYTALAPSVSLAAGSAYYVASQESSGGDSWYDWGGVSATNVASVSNAIYSWDSVSWLAPPIVANTSYVPPNFTYVTQ